MDNITHSITAIAISTVCLKNTKAQKYIWRFIFISLFLANAPDFDFVLYFIEKELYYEQHRGYTHSILGLFTFVPVGYWIIKKVYNNIEISNKTALITSFSLWFFGHFVLDYFTVYGIQIFWPINVVHYDFALMFIIDLIVWGFCIIYLILMLFKFNKLKVSYFFLGTLTFIYSAYFVNRIYITNHFSKQHNVADVRYNVFINTFYMTNVYGFDNQGKFIQKIYYLTKPIESGHKFVNNHYPYVNTNIWHINKLPNNGSYSKTAQDKFNHYIGFGGIVACKKIKIGAECISFKYYTPSFNNKLLKRKTLGKIIKFNYPK